MYKILVLFLFFLIVVALPLFYKQDFNSEGFSNYYLGSTDGIYPSSQIDVLVQDTYPITGKNGVSNDGSNKIWWHYPIFSLPSFKQQTNNLRYRYNPDEGTCTRPEFCGALYHNIKNKSNEINPLPPAEEGTGARVGYFRTEPNELYYSIPTNENILY